MSWLESVRELIPPLLWRTAQTARARWRYGRPPAWELPVRSLDEIWPGMNSAAVAMIPNQIRRHLWGMPEHELLVLGAVTQALRPDRIVEFGTFTGASTLAMALNSRSHTRIVTVDVDPADRPSHVHGLGVGLIEFRVGEVFKDTAWHAKIEQRLCDTRLFTMPEWEGQVGLFLVDADHTYDFVRSDTAFANTMLSPRGAIVWHDYTWSPDAAECGGVTRAVNEYHQRHGNCFQIAGTRFAIYLKTPRG